MDYGPSLTHTYEIPGGKPNFAYKGIAVRLDPGAGGVVRAGIGWRLIPIRSAWRPPGAP